MKFKKLTIMVDEAEGTGDTSRVFKVIQDVEVISGSGYGQVLVARQGSEVVAELHTWDDNPIEITGEGILASGNIYGTTEMQDYAEWILEAVESGE